MTTNQRDSRFWQQKMKESPLRILRHTPPDAGIPMPTDEERKAIAEARKRYRIAMGFDKPVDDFESVRRNTDLFHFAHILKRPSLEDIVFDSYLLDPEDVALMKSSFGDENQADFVMAVTGLPTLTYVGAMYEIAVAELNVEGLNDSEYALAVKQEYLAATLIVKLTMEMRGIPIEERLLH